MYIIILSEFIKVRLHTQLRSILTMLILPLVLRVPLTSGMLEQLNLIQKLWKTYTIQGKCSYEGENR